MSIEKSSVSLRSLFQAILTNLLSFEECFGLMHIPRSANPDDTVPGDSIEHFKQGIERLTELNSQMAQQFSTFTASKQTRCGLAAFDAGTSAVKNQCK